jgi:FkbM family methyltransferase
LKVLFSIARAVLVALTGRGYDRSPAVNDVHHKLAYRLHKLLPQMGVTGEQMIDVPGAPGMKMIVRAEDGGVGHQLLMYRAYEPFETSVVLKHLLPDDVVYVIGANIGYYPIVCASTGARVFAFEPDPTNFDLLTRSIAMNKLGNITPMPMAIGSRDGGTVLSVSPTNSGDHQTGLVEGRSHIRVAVRTLDSLNADGVAPPNVIIMDVQGAEMEAVRGAWELLKNKTVRAIFTEFWPDGLDRREAGSAVAFIQILREAGFQLFEISERSHSITPFDARSIERMSNIEEKNLLCVRSAG